MAITSKEIEKFCQIDGWTFRNGSNHIVASKKLADGTPLQTQICHDKNKEFSPGASNRICKISLALAGGELELRQVLKTGIPPERAHLGVDEIPQKESLTTQVADALTNECKLRPDQLKELTNDQGRGIVIAQRFGVPIKDLSSEQIQTALTFIEEHSVTDEMKIYETFDGVSAGFSPQELRDLLGTSVAQKDHDLDMAV